MMHTRLIKLTALALTLCLLSGTMNVLAAPAREIGALETDDVDGLQALTEIAVGAACLAAGTQDDAAMLQGLPRGQAPDARLTEAAMLLAVERTCQTTYISREDIAQLYREIFAAGKYAVSEPVFFQTADGGLDAGAMIPQMPGLNVYLYSAEFDGEVMTVKADLYAVRTEYAGSTLEALPESAMTWACGAVIALQPAPDTVFGYTLLGFDFTAPYQDGALSVWKEVENEEYKYSLSVPASMQLVQQGDGRKMIWQSADGAVTLTVEAVDMCYVCSEYEPFEKALKQIVSEVGADLARIVTPEPDFDRISTLGDGIFTLEVLAEEMPWIYDITLTFPLEMQAEYSLYAEFIRNSFSAWEISNG